MKIITNSEYVHLLIAEDERGVYKEEAISLRRQLHAKSQEAHEKAYDRYVRPLERELKASEAARKKLDEDIAVLKTALIQLGGAVISI